MTRSAPEAASRPSLDEVARRVARRVREQSLAYRREPEAVFAERVREAIEAVLASAASRSTGGVRAYVDRLIPLRARQGVTASDLIAYATTLEGALGELVTREDGEAALGSPRWRGIQAVLRDAMGYAVTGVGDYLAERRDADTRRFMALLDVLPEVVFLIDDRRVVQHANRALREQFGVQPGEILGKPLGQAFLPRFLELQADPDAYMAATRQILAAPDRVHEDEFLLKDGRVMNRRSLPVFDEAFIGRLVILSDVTVHRERERHAATLLSHLVMAQEQERRLVAADLHDGPVQVLAAALLRIDSLHEKLSLLDDERLSALIGALADDLRRAYEEARTVLFSLSPELLEAGDLAAAARELLDRVRWEAGVETHLEDRLESRPPRELELVAFRVLQEALANIRKHARARAVVVRLAGVEGIECEVRDDGLGFDPEVLEQRLRAGHIGVASMRERVELAGGSFELESAPGEGTRIRFTLPPLAA